MAQYRQPFKKPGTDETLNLCPVCWNNGYSREVEEMTLWRCDDSDLLYESSDAHFFSEEPSAQEGWWCTRCENFSETSHVREHAVWVCPHCKEEWDDYDEADGCCNEDDED